MARVGKEGETRPGRAVAWLLALALALPTASLAWQLAGALSRARLQATVTAPHAWRTAWAGLRQAARDGLPGAAHLLPRVARLKHRWQISSNPLVLYGRDDWLFYNDRASWGSMTHSRPFTAAQLQAWRTALVNQHAWLRDQGVAFVFSVPPDKHSVYGQHLRVRPTPVGPSRRAQLLAALADTEVPVADVLPLLLAQRDAWQLYHRTDTHWNDLGAYWGYRGLLQQLQPQGLALQPAAWDDFEIVNGPAVGLDLVHMLGLTGQPLERPWSLHPRQPRRAAIDRAAAGPDPASPALGASGTTTYWHSTCDLPEPRGLLMFRDSFGDGLIPLLAEHFTTGLYVSSTNFDASLVQKLQPRAVILQLVERTLQDLPPPPERPLPVGAEAVLYGDGFFAQEQVGPAVFRWMGPKGELQVQAPARASALLIEVDGPDLQILQDGVPVPCRPVAGTRRQRRCPLPAASGPATGAWRQLQLHAADSFVPFERSHGREPDGRRLAVKIYAVRSAP